jgi:hypothetical protein
VLVELGVVEQHIRLDGVPVFFVALPTKHLLDSRPA